MPLVGLFLVSSGMLHLDWSFSIGNIIAIVTLLGIYGHASSKLAKVEGKLNIMFAWWCREVLPKTNDPKIAEEIQKFFR
jgi:hypothetical protein